MSPHHSRNSYQAQIQLIAAVKQRVGVGALWYQSPNGIVCIGPLNHPSGSPDAIDPLFTHGTITVTYDDGKTSAVEFWFDIDFEDLTRTFTFSWTSGSTDTNIAPVNPTKGWMGTPGLAYDFGQPANLTSYTITPPSTTPAVWTATEVYAAQYDSSTPPNLIKHGVTIDWVLDRDYAFKDYVLLCDQLLAAAGLLDAIANPTQSYPYMYVGAPNGYVRFPQEFGPWTDGNFLRQVANSMRVRRSRSLAPSWQYDAWTGSPGASGISDNRTYAIFADLTPSCSWISATPFKSPSSSSHYAYNWNNNPLFMHGCPVNSGTTIIPITGTPAAATDNVRYICSVKSAFATHALTSLACWSYDPSSNTWTSQSFTPVAASQGGRFILDPVANLASGDVPSGYVQDPSGGIFTVDATTPFDSSNPDTLFGFASGTI